MLRSSGLGQVLGSLVANRVLAIRLVHWLGWVFENKERKKERKKEILTGAGKRNRNSIVREQRLFSNVPGTRSRNTKRKPIAGLSRLRHPARARKLRFSMKDKKSFCNGSRARARWPMRLVLVRATLRSDVDVISAHLSSFARSIFPCAALC